MIADVHRFVQKEYNFNKITRGVACRIFLLLGYDLSVRELYEMYDRLMEEINGTYTYVDPNHSARKP